MPKYTICTRERVTLYRRYEFDSGDAEMTDADALCLLDCQSKDMRLIETIDEAPFPDIEIDEIFNHDTTCPECGTMWVYHDIDQHWALHPDAVNLPARRRVSRILKPWAMAKRIEMRQQSDDFDPGNPNYCPKCGGNWATHNGDGSCVEDEPEIIDIKPKANLDYFERILTHYIALALDRSGVVPDSDTYAELKEAFAQLRRAL